MAQTTFEAQDAEALLAKLQEFHDAIRNEWSQVLNKWSNLQSVWHDEQFDQFEPIFEEFLSTYNSAEQESEKYIDFLKRQIALDEDRKQKLANRLNRM